MGAEKGLTAVSVGTKINGIGGYVFEYALDMFIPLSGVVSQAIIGSFGSDSTHKNVFINELCYSCVGGTIEGHSNGHVNDELLAIAAERIGFNNGGVTTIITNEFLYGVNAYLNCFNAERERGILFHVGTPSGTSNNIVFKFFEK